MGQVQSLFLSACSGESTWSVHPGLTVFICGASGGVDLEGSGEGLPLIVCHVHPCPCPASRPAEPLRRRQHPGVCRRHRLSLRAGPASLQETAFFRLLRSDLVGVRGESDWRGHLTRRGGAGGPGPGTVWRAGPRSGFHAELQFGISPPGHTPRFYLKNNTF